MLKARKSYRNQVLSSEWAVFTKRELAEMLTHDGNVDFLMKLSKAELVQQVERAAR